MLNDPPTVRSIVNHFTWNLLENMTNRFPHIPNFAWISHALPLKLRMVKAKNETFNAIITNSVLNRPDFP